MRRAFRPPVTVPPTQRLARAIELLPPTAVAALAQVAERDDLPLVAGSWRAAGSGCLVANALAAASARGAGDVAETLDVRILEEFPELSSRDLNRLIVAWDEAAAEAGADDDAALRRLLGEALAVAGPGDRTPAGGRSGALA